MKNENLKPVLCYIVKATGKQYLDRYCASIEQAERLANYYNNGAVAIIEGKQYDSTTAIFYATYQEEMK